MSILHFLKAILDVFISKFPKFVKSLFGKIPAELSAQLEAIIQTVNNIKTYVDSPGMDFLTAVIPGTLDDELKRWLRISLPWVLDGLGIVKDGLIQFSEDPDIRSTQLQSAATLLTAALTKMPISQAAITSQVVYQNS